MPTLFSDADGRYRSFDGEIRDAYWGPFYTDFSLWDTYRTTHPLLVLLWKEQTADMMDSLAAMARASAFLDGRGFVSPDDVKAVGVDVMRHRILLTYEAEADGLSVEDVIDRVFQKVKVS